MDEWISGKKPIPLRWIDPVHAIPKEAVPEEPPNQGMEPIDPDLINPPESEATDADDLSLGEQALVSNYRTLASVPRLATRHYLLDGDSRLVRILYDRVFLGLRHR